MTPPSPRTRVLLGGGPSGSTAASLLARDGIEVTLIEREVFPRYHIDESLLLSCLEIALLRYARSQGTGDHEGVEVQALDFDETGRPCRAHWVRRDDPSVSGVIAFDNLIDASGHNGIMASRYLRNREFTGCPKRGAVGLLGGRRLQRARLSGGLHRGRPDPGRLALVDPAGRRPHQHRSRAAQRPPSAG